jgi:alkylhydroperoxidase family enzyme
MAYPTAYASKVAIPLPSDEAVREIMGRSYDPERTLNVLKMFAGTEDMFEATIGLVKAVFQAQGIDTKIREMIILRAAKVLNAPYEWQATRVCLPQRSTLRRATDRCLASTRNSSSCVRRPTNCRRAALYATRR